MRSDATSEAPHEDPPSGAREVALLREAAERACARIAPTWPLDRFIAVNPFWSRTDKPLSRVADELAALSGARLLAPRAWYAEEWREGRLRAEHLRAAIAESGVDVTEERLVALLDVEEPPLRRRPLVVDVMDARCRRELETTWREFIMEKMSRFCGSYFDDGQAQVGGVRDGGFYASWRHKARGDRAPALFMQLNGYRNAVASLPDTADEMIRIAWSDLGVPAEECEHYLSALLLDINGWASWCAYLRWTARLAGRDDDHIFELLAIRIAWEWILLSADDEGLRAAWRLSMGGWAVSDHAPYSPRAHDWLLQRAIEIAWLGPLRQNLPGGFPAGRSPAPKLQAAFCLDVRSEIYRRALEAQGDDIETLGVAGFFGVPIEYAPLGADVARPQLPGLMAPKYRVTDTGTPAGLEAKRRGRLQAGHAWKAFKSSSLSSFAFVDSIGPFLAASLFGDSFGSGAHRADHHDREGLSEVEDRSRSPRITSRVDGTALSAEERCELAEGILRSMSLTRGFARVVLLVGHGSETRNNAHAAALDCGACCGQPGEVNARAAVDLLNDVDVRARLASRGITVPASTRFVAGLHNTTTDEITLFDGGSIAERSELPQIRALLERASNAARRERAPKLGLGELSDAKLRAAVVKRARNWAEVRPEWGLAGNAAFIIAPRERTRHLDLEGRAFLHDYRSGEDGDFTVLENLMTGPMVVAHWINFQYYASTVDNVRYGSGNKVLHNIVGGHLGVFEGNGGDLRIGLSLQSISDGERWMHTPVRLGVFIEAPRVAIERVLEKHAKVRELVDNEWLHLFQLDADERAVVARRRGKWFPPSA